MEDFDEEDVDDLDIEETMDDSFAAPGINTTAGLVGAMHQEQGIVRAARSPSPEGSASDFSDGESSSSENVIRKSKTGLRKVDKSRVEKSKVSDFGEIALKERANQKANLILRTLIVHRNLLWSSLTITKLGMMGMESLT